MLVFDYVRGEHSTGTAFADSNGEITVVKKLGNPFELMDSKSFDREASKTTNMMIMGHNRYATQGKVNKVNAHPFQFGTTVGAHNGTLRSGRGLEDYNKFDVDSQALMFNIANKGMDVVEEIDGAFALTVYNQETKELSIIRNKERPLFMTVTEDEKTLFWASEEWMLSVALSRNGVEFLPIIQTEVGTLYTFYKGADGKIGMVEEKKNMYVAPPPVTRTHYGSYFSAPKEEIRFYVDKIKKNTPSNSSEYFSCVLLDVGKAEVKVFANHDPDLYKLLKESTQAFIGEVSSRSFCGGQETIYVRQDSIKEVAWEEALDEGEDDEPILWLHPDGRLIDKEEWEKVKKTGCCVCSQTFTDDDAGELEEIMGHPCCKGCSVTYLDEGVA